MSCKRIAVLKRRDVPVYDPVNSSSGLSSSASRLQCSGSSIDNLRNSWCRSIQSNCCMISMCAISHCLVTLTIGNRRNRSGLTGATLALAIERLVGAFLAVAFAVATTWLPPGLATAMGDARTIVKIEK